MMGDVSQRSRLLVTFTASFSSINHECTVSNDETDSRSPTALKMKLLMTWTLCDYVPSDYDEAHNFTVDPAVYFIPGAFHYEIY